MLSRILCHLLQRSNRIAVVKDTAPSLLITIYYRGHTGLLLSRTQLLSYLLQSYRTADLVQSSLSFITEVTQDCCCQGHYFLTYHNLIGLLILSRIICHLLQRAYWIAVVIDTLSLSPYFRTEDLVQNSLLLLQRSYMIAVIKDTSSLLTTTLSDC